MEFSIGADTTCDLPVAWTLDLNKSTKCRHRINWLNIIIGQCLCHTHCVSICCSLVSVLLSFHHPFTDFILIKSFPFVFTHVEATLCLYITLKKDMFGNELQYFLAGRLFCFCAKLPEGQDCNAFQLSSDIYSYLYLINWQVW